MSDRKYRQRGYQEHNSEPQQRPTSRPQPKPRQAAHNHEAPRSPRMMAFGEAVKCTSCGAKAPGVIDFETTCAKCRAELHSCRQCNYFDPGAHFECSKTIAKRIVNKNARNVCDLYAPRTVIERETSSSSAPTDARQAFANLFKK
ncbi:MAG TPA: hypothetical protein VI306_05630 [Pyrinomonadaceae bacterium]